MKLEQNTLNYAAGTGTTTGYIDLARNLSAVNGKSIAQTKRSKGKYKPLGYLVRVRVEAGAAVTVETLNCGYPTRNAVVLAGHARDEMLKSAGISRSNLESYQKELRIFMDGTMDGGSNQFFPGASDVGTGSGGWGEGLTYDYTKLTIDRPDSSTQQTITKALAMLGTQAAASDDWDADGEFYVIDNWHRWRHSFTPAAATDDIDNNVFSWAIQQSDTSEDIINMIDDSQDEKPYDLVEFKTNTMSTLVSPSVGNPTSAVVCAPLGLLKVAAIADGSVTPKWSVEVVGVVEL